MINLPSFIHTWNEWCLKAQDLDQDTVALHMPFCPLLDENMIIYLEKNREGILIHDNGETFNALTSNFGIVGDELTGEQEAYLDYVVQFNKVDFTDGVFSLQSSPERGRLFSDTTRFVQCLLQVHTINALRRKERESNFARQVYDKLSPKINGLRYNVALEFNIPGTKNHVRRVADLYLKNGGLIIAKALLEKESVDTTVATWNMVERATGNHPNIESSTFRNVKKIQKVTIYDKDLPGFYIDLLERLYNNVYCIQEQEAEIVSAFTGK